MSYTPVVSQYHDFLASAMLPYDGMTLRKHEIMMALLAKYSHLSDKRDWIYPSDHCENHVCKGACVCLCGITERHRQTRRSWNLHCRHWRLPAKCVNDSSRSMNGFRILDFSMAWITDPLGHRTSSLACSQS